MTPRLGLGKRALRGAAVLVLAAVVCLTLGVAVVGAGYLLLELL